MSALGQKAKYSRRADVFRCSPDIGHSARARAGHAESVPPHRSSFFIVQTRLNARRSSGLSDRPLPWRHAGPDLRSLSGIFDKR